MFVRPVVAVAGIAFDERGRVLLVLRDRDPGRGLWTVPGGKVEAGETLAEATAREVGEETGLAVAVGPLIEVVERIASDAQGDLLYHYVIHDFAVSVVGGDLRAGDDAGDARWVAWDELDDLPLTDGLEAVLARARAKALAPAGGAR